MPVVVDNVEGRVEAPPTPEDPSEEPSEAEARPPGDGDLEHQLCRRGRRNHRLTAD